MTGLLFKHHCARIRTASRAGLTPSPTEPVPATVVPRKGDAAKRQKSGPSASALLSEKPKEGFLKEGVTFYTRKSDRISTPPRIGSQVIFNPKRKPPAKPKEDTNE